MSENIDPDASTDKAAQIDKKTGGEYKGLRPPFKQQVKRLEDNAGVEERPFYIASDDPHYPRRGVWMVNQHLRKTWGDDLRVAEQDKAYYNGGAGDPTPRSSPEEGVPKIPTIFRLPNAYATYSVVCSDPFLLEGTVEDRADELGIETTREYADALRAADTRPRYVGYTRNPYWDVGIQLDRENPLAEKLPRLCPPLKIDSMSWHSQKSEAKRAQKQTAADYRDVGYFAEPFK